MYQCIRGCTYDYETKLQEYLFKLGLGSLGHGGKRLLTMDGGRERDTRSQIADKQNMGHVGISGSGMLPGLPELLARTSRSTRPSLTVTPFTSPVHLVISRHDYFTISLRHLLLL